MTQSKTKYWLFGFLLFALCLIWMPTTGAAAGAAEAQAAQTGVEDGAPSGSEAAEPVDADGAGTAEEREAETAAAAGDKTEFRSASGNGAQESGVTAAAQVPFKDLTRYQWEDGKKAIQAMTRSRIINGFPDGTFRPSELITRRQAAKIVAMAAGLKPAPAAFADVEPGLSYIGALQQAGIVSGDREGRYRPNDHLTRAQLAKMIVLAYGLEMKEEPKLSDVPDTDLGHYVRIAASNGVMTGYEDGTFRPNQPVKRDQAAVMIHRAMQLAGDGQAPDDDSESGNDGNDVRPPDDSGNGLLPGHTGWSAERPFRLFVDAGHGGEDPGAIGKLTDGGKIQEKDINLDIALEIARIFREEYAYVDVRMSRSDDTYVMLQERARQANEWGADYFVSIHVNSSDNAAAYGFESYIYNGPVSQETVEKQRIVHQVIVEKMGFRDRGMKRANFAVLRESKMPAILLENLFISNLAEAEQLNDPEFRKQLARATAEGIAAAWNVLRYDELAALPSGEAAGGTGDSSQVEEAGKQSGDDTDDATDADKAGQD